MGLSNWKLFVTEKAGRRVEGLEKLYGSQLIWKIDNYTAKLEEAKAGKKPTIFSPPFLTSRHGYKLAMSCCLYGDGKGVDLYKHIFVPKTSRHAILISLLTLVTHQHSAYSRRTNCVQGSLSTVDFDRVLWIFLYWFSFLTFNNRVQDIYIQATI